MEKSSNQKRDQALSPDANKFFHAFPNTLQQIKNALGMSPWKKFFKHENHIPWVFVLGPSQSGKSSLVENAGLNIKARAATQEQHYPYWITEEALYLELPGIAVSNEKWIDYWEHLSDSFQNNGCARHLRGIVLTLNIAQLYHQTTQQQLDLSLYLRAIIQNFQNKSKHPLKLTLVFTHLDLIAGCSDYFLELTPEKQAAPFGFSLNTLHSIEDFEKQFHTKFQHLLQHLQRRVIDIMHPQQQANIQQRAQDFPLQLESLKKLFYNITKTLVAGTQSTDKNETLDVLNPDVLSLDGIFFVANRMQGIPIDNVSKIIQRSFDLERSAVPNQKRQRKTLFTHDLLRYIIPSRPEKFIPLTRISSVLNRISERGQRNAVLSALSVFLVVGVGMIFAQFNQGIHTLGKIEQALTEYNLKPEHVKLKSLDNIAKATQTLKRTSPPPKHFYNHIPSLTHSLDKFYHYAMSHNILAKINKDLAGQLQKDFLTPNKRYNLLKIYLMLAEPKHRDNAFLMKQLQFYWQSQLFNNEKIEALNKHLSAALQADVASVDVNKKLVAESREKLTKLPLPFLAYTILKSKAQTHPGITIEAVTDNVFASNKKTIPYLYTKKGYQSLEPQLKTIVDNLRDGDWVLGKKEISEENLTNLASQVKTLYLTDYVNWWNLALYNIHPIVFKNPSQATNLLEKFMGQKSGYLSMIDLINENTSAFTNPDEDEKIFNQQVAAPFHKVNQLSANKLTAFNKKLSHLNDLLQELSEEDNSDAKAFELLKKQFESAEANNPIKQLFEASKPLPSPIRQWFQAIALNAWYTLIEKTQNHLNTTWRQQVYNEYAMFIEHRYPLQKDAPQDVSLIDFQRFFGPDGTFDQYFTHYLKPFINTQHPDWEMKPFLGLKLHIDPETIKQFERAAIIRDMFFDHHHKNLKVDFSLRPIQLSNQIKDIIINFSGKKVFDYPGSNKLTHFTWPDANHEKLATVSIENAKNQLYTVSKNGEWAFFKLMDQMHLEKQSDVKHYVLHISHEGHRADYALESARLINPFIPGGIIQQFKLPEDVVKTTKKSFA